jgi:hypothetical protein
MRKRDYLSDSGSELRSAITAAFRDLELRSPPATQVPDYFVDIVKRLQDVLPIGRAFLAVRESSGTRLIATATFGAHKVRKNLNLKIPAISSLFQKVSDGGIAFTDNCSQFFSGNNLERNLLLDHSSRAYTLIPLKHEGHTVGMLGMSSERPEAFSIVDEGLLDGVVANLARRVVSTSLRVSSPAIDQWSEPLF